MVEFTGLKHRETVPRDCREAESEDASQRNERETNVRTCEEERIAEEEKIARPYAGVKNALRQRLAEWETHPVSSPEKHPSQLTIAQVCFGAGEASPETSSGHHKHKLTNCKSFMKENVECRRHFAQTQRLCFNCLSPEHSVYMCTVSTSCRLCKKRHHTLLHPKTLQPSKLEPPEGKKVAAVVTDMPASFMENEESETEDVETHEVVTTCFASSRSTVLLATALVSAKALSHTSSSANVLRALIDQGSQASFITEAAAQLLGLRKSTECVKVSGLGGSRALESKSSVKIQIASRADPSFLLTVKAHVLSKLTTLLPSNKVTVSYDQMQVLPTLELADPSYNCPGAIDLLLGAEVHSQIIMEGLVQGANGNFIAQKTRFGWMLSGLVEDTSSHENQHFKCHTTMINSFEEDGLLKKFWELESEPVLSKKLLTREEQACEELFAETTRRDETGRYVVKLPFKHENPASKHSGSYDIARRRLFALEKRLSSNPVLKVEYSNVINEYLTMKHMEVCTDNNKSDAVYLPHHAVIREDKSTTKVRVVFDASCKGFNGASLNGDLMIGPTLQPELRHLVMRWRCYPISLVADIAKMYRQVAVAYEDTDFQRILWRENPEEEIQHLRLLRVTFGTASAPYLAVRALQQVAHDEGAEFPLAKDRVLTDFYVDDFMSGCHSVAEGVLVFEQTTELLSRAGFPLQKWASNNKELLQTISSKGQDELNQNLELKIDDIMKVLGLTWDKETDEFRFKVNLPSLSEAPITKRKLIAEQCMEDLN
ncbi:uncharacterized protein LOC126381282 [Pectinophora gossypiella]|uniref:uncharacterized protein LOC126381282 n=1 Tax=Pectinophora gossypiella TaxID=13191 RepID=UPI00214E3EE8|nr:uncharacterized protein LOC126381282 [Pectinophora gossypiella]